MTGLIVAADPDGVIGYRGRIPWYSRADLRRFRKVTTGGTLIMGRRTFEGLPSRLYRRKVVVVSRQPTPRGPFPPDAVAAGLWEALAKAEDLGGPTWIAGGGQVYAEAMAAGCVDIIDFTLMPSTRLAEKLGVVTFPMDSLEDYHLVLSAQNPIDPTLYHRIYHR